VAAKNPGIKSDGESSVNCSLLRNGLSPGERTSVDVGLRVRVQYESQAEGSSPPGGSRLGLTLDSATTRTSSSLDDGCSLASARFRSRWLSLGAAVGLRCFQSSTVPSP
jgi:hypothetical protein